MMLKATMNYTSEDVKKYCRSIRSSKGIFGFYILLFIVYTAAVILFILNDTPAYSLAALLCVQIFITAIFLFMVFTAKKLPEKEYEKLRQKYKGRPVFFDFDYSKVVICTKDSKDDFYDAIEYKKFDGAVETDEFFCFVQKNQDDIFLNKSAFTDGTAKDLEDILITHLDDKFTIKCSRELDF